MLSGGLLLFQLLSLTLRIPRSSISEALFMTLLLVALPLNFGLIVGQIRSVDVVLSGSPIPLLAVCR
jgi:hypothetical protein